MAARIMITLTRPQAESIQEALEDVSTRTWGNTRTFREVRRKLKEAMSANTPYRRTVETVAVPSET